jgi:formate hydrogenlyase transcriptional activator
LEELLQWNLEDVRDAEGDSTEDEHLSTSMPIWRVMELRQSGSRTTQNPSHVRLMTLFSSAVRLPYTEIFSIDKSWLPKQPSLTEPKNQMELPQRLVAQEKEMIEAALKESRGRIFGPTGAAAKLGIPRSTLESKVRSLKIDKNRFRTSSEI